MLKFTKGKWNKNGGFVVIGTGNQTEKGLCFKSVCAMHGTALRYEQKETQANQKLICMAPDMYRTLYAQYVLCWQIFWYFSPLEQANMWMFKDKQGRKLGETACYLCEEGFPVWDDNLIAIFEKEVEKLNSDD